jgi:hypothetical protein
MERLVSQEKGDELEQGAPFFFSVPARVRELGPAVALDLGFCDGVAVFFLQK